MSMHNLLAPTTLAVNKKEKFHRSRSRLGYHVFVSRFFCEFNSLNPIDKENVLVSYGVWQDSSDVSVDSCQTPRTPRVFEISLAAARYWRQVPRLTRSSWNERAKFLNKLPRTDGTLDNIPTSLLSQSLHNTILTTLSMEWKNVCKMLYLSTTKYSPVVNSTKTYRFGNEIVSLNSQKYTCFCLTYLLLLSISGSPLYSNLNSYEIVHRYKKSVVLHLFSYKRMMDLFTFGGKSFATHWRNDFGYLLYDRVNLCMNGKNIVGEIIDEDDENLMIRVDKESGGHDKVVIKRPSFDHDIGSFNYPLHNSSDTYILTQMFPLRMKISNNGKIAMIFNYYISTEKDYSNILNLF